MNANEEYSQPIITQRQREEEERNRKGDYKREKDQAEENVREIERRLKVATYKIHTWKEREDGRNNEYLRLLFGKESLIAEKEGLEREYRKKRDIVIYWIRREWEVKNSLKLEEKEKAKFYSDFKRKLIISKPRRN